MNFLLDTNAAVALLRNKPSQVRDRYLRAKESGDYLALSSVVLFELWYGVMKSGYIQQNTERLRILLSGDLDVLDFDHDDAHTAARIRAQLKGKRTLIGPYDLLIAAQAFRRDLTVVTANTGEFNRVPGLSAQDWTT